MTIEVACQCGKRFAAQPHLAGKQVRCPSCSSPLAIPVPEPLQATTMPIEVSCQCGQRFRAPPHLAGKQVKCPMCHQPLFVPFESFPALQPQMEWTQPTGPLAAGPLPAWYGNQMPQFPMATQNAATSSWSNADPMANLGKSNAQSLLANAYEERAGWNQQTSEWGTKQIITGILMMIGAVVWFVLGLFANRIFFYPPILFVLGAIALIKGILQKFSR